MSCCFMECACGKVFNDANVLILKDIKNFTGRKVYYAHCPSCSQLVLTLVEKDVNSGKIFVNENISGRAAEKILTREYKRAVTIFPNIKYDSLYGWIYGHNVQIKNKKGQVVRLRQYASDFKGNRKLVKSLSVNN